MAKYVEIVFRFKLRFLLLLLILPAAVATVTVLLFPSYKATAQLWVDDPGYFSPSAPIGWSVYLTPAQNQSDSLTQLVSTQAFRKDLYDALADSIPDRAERVRVIASAKLLVAPTGSHLMLVSGSCDRPAICVLVVSKAIDVLRTEQVSMQKNNAKSGVSFLTAELQQAQTDQHQAEDALRRYIATHPGAKIDANVNPDAISDPDLARLAADVQQKRNHVNDLQAQIDRNNAVASASTAVFQAGPHVIDKPSVAQAGLLGDRSSLKKAGMAAGAMLALGLVYLFLLGWADKTLRDPRDIERRFIVRVVTTIPEFQPAERF